MIYKYKKILIASNNKGKVKEITSLLANLDIEVISPQIFNLEEPIENGINFAENSLIKAKFYAQQTNLVALADDSGLCIEALDNQPGIHSARFAIDLNGEKNYSLAFEKIFQKLKNRGINNSNQAKAFFICSLCLYDPLINVATNFIGRIDGNISFEAKGNYGFGYDPIFIKSGYNQTFGEILPQQKEKISHRNIAFEKLTKWLEEK